MKKSTPKKSVKSVKKVAKKTVSKTTKKSVKTSSSPTTKNTPTFSRNFSPFQVILWLSIIFSTILIIVSNL